jgi:hypothetical protein
MLRKGLLWAICKEYVPIDRKNSRTVILDIIIDIILLDDFYFWCFSIFNANWQKTTYKIVLYCIVSFV